VISACTPQVSAETVSLLEQLLEEARAGTVTGLAIAVLRSTGNYDLRLRGSATESGNQMSVAGMLSALQKMVLELAD
jgi:purine nucleoside permease